MGISTIIGIAVAGIGIFGGFMIEGGAIMSLFNIPGSMIVVVGTLGATMTAFPLSSENYIRRHLPALLVAVIVRAVDHDGSHANDRHQRHQRHQRHDAGKQRRQMTPDRRGNDADSRAFGFLGGILSG